MVLTRTPLMVSCKRNKIWTDKHIYNWQPETMSYFPKGHRRDDDVPEFDEYDETPYGGGYDISLTYGHPIPPSEETCYPLTSSASDDFDYDRPHYSSSAEPSVYGGEALDNEYQSYSKPNSRPSRSRPSRDGDGDEDEEEKPRRKPGMNRPGGGYGEESEYDGGRIESDESGYGRKGRYEDESSEYNNPSSEYGSRQRRKNEDEEEISEYGSGYGGRKTDSDEYGSGYNGRKSEYEENSGYGRKTDTDEYGSGYRRKSEYEEESSEYGSGYGRKAELDEYGSKPASGYGSRNRRNKDDEERNSEYGSNYGRNRESDEYGTSFERPSYGRSEEEDYRKPSYGRRDDDDEGYGRNKYGDDGSDEDEEKKQRHRNRHYRQDYDD